MKHWEEIRYYALKTMAASSTFIIGWIFIIKNFSSWVTAAEYFIPVWATKGPTHQKKNSRKALCVYANAVKPNTGLSSQVYCLFSWNIHAIVCKKSLILVVQGCYHILQLHDNLTTSADVRKQLLRKLKSQSGRSLRLCTSVNHSTVNFKHQKGVCPSPQNFYFIYPPPTSPL